MTLNYDIFETELGWMGVIGGDRGLKRTTLPQADPAACVEELGHELDKAVQATSVFEELKTRIERQFSGEPVTFTDLELDVKDARPFFQSAWAACRTIPCGKHTYVWLACGSSRKSGGSTGSRASYGAKQIAYRGAMSPRCCK